MSDSIGSEKLLAGHAPATMVGGMRVGGISRPAEKSSKAGNNDANVSSDEEKKIVDETISSNTNSSPEKLNNSRLVSKTVGMVVNNQFVDLKDAFPTEAIKHIQDKPMAVHENRVPSNSKKTPGGHIFQPRSYMQPSK